MLKARVLTVLVLLPLLLAALFYLPNFYWAVLTLCIALVGASEWAKIASLSSAASSLYLVGTLGLGIFLMYLTGPGSAGTEWPNHLLYGASLVFWLFAAPFWLANGWQIRNRVVLAVVGWIILLPTWMALVQLQATSPALLLAVMAVVWIADSAAYFSGRRFGKHKLAPSISPGKTWEGVAGAFFAVAVYAFIWTGIDSRLSDFATATNLPPVLAVVLVLWLMTYFSILGDLFESWMKRQAGIKDSGNVLPGHGGILDRIDALTSSLPLVALVLLWLNISLHQ